MRKTRKTGKTIKTFSGVYKWEGKRINGWKKRKNKKNDKNKKNIARGGIGGHHPPCGLEASFFRAGGGQMSVHKLMGAKLEIQPDYGMEF